MSKYYWKYDDSYEFMEHVIDMPPAIICVAINGGVQGKETNINIPETVEEIAQSAKEAYDAGASMIHVHARKPDCLWKGANTKEQWWDVNKRIRELCPEIVINNTTGGSSGQPFDEKLACLDANPEIASLNIVPDMEISIVKERKAPLLHPHPRLVFNETTAYTYENISFFASEMQKRNIKPEIETYHPGGAWVINHLIEKGLIEAPYWIQTVMGYQTSSYPTPGHMLSILKDLPKDTIWLSSGIGQYQIPMTTMALLMGGHARVGLEDNVYYSRGNKAKSNAQLVARTARIIKELNRTVATPKETREMLGLSMTPSKYN